MIVVASSPEDVAGLLGRLDELGAHARVVASSETRRLVLVDVEDESAAVRLAATLRAEGEIAVIRPDAGPRLDAWNEHTRPVTLGEQLSVCFAWSEHDRSGLPGMIELGLGGFGSGQHLSTRLLVEQLSERITGGERVLDVGCGSGVLGLCALQLGAAHVVAMDIKPEAVEATRRNAERNGMDERLDATLDPLATMDGEFDVIVANVGRSVIVELAPQLIRLVSPRGWLALSGISPPQCSLVAGFLRPLLEIDRRTLGEWSALVVAHPVPAGGGMLG